MWPAEVHHPPPVTAEHPHEVEETGGEDTEQAKLPVQGADHSSLEISRKSFYTFTHSSELERYSLYKYTTFIYNFQSQRYDYLISVIIVVDAVVVKDHIN